MKKEPRYAKCEDCGKRIFYKNATSMNGWLQSGKSKYGTRYCPDGIAWLCGRCEEKS